MSKGKQRKLTTFLPAFFLFNTSFSWDFVSTVNSTSLLWKDGLITLNQEVRIPQIADTGLSYKAIKFATDCYEESKHCLLSTDLNI